MPESTSLPEKIKCIKTTRTKSRKSCPSILNFFKLLEEMETNKIFEKSGNFTCKGPLDSKIESAYHIKINSEKEAEKPDIPASSKLRTKTKSKYR